MRVSPLVLEKLTSDQKFRLNTALALDCGERNVMVLVERNSEKLANEKAVEYYLSQGLTLEDILERKTQKS